MVGIEGYYEDNPNVKIITNLDDIGQPYSCQQWGDRHQFYNPDVFPLMTDDGNQDVLWSLLNTGGAFPSTAYIDHTMTVFFKGNNAQFGAATATIDSMIDECGDLCTLSPPAALFDFEIDGNTVTFFDFSEIASEGWIIESWAWDFGDGNTSSEQYPVHTYENEGTYQVSLVITTDIGTESVPFVADIQIGTLNISDNNLPEDFGLVKNYPNPFNPNTTIEYYLGESGMVTMNAYDVNGKLIDSIVNTYQVSGKHSIIWQPNNISSGMYYINLVQGMNTDKMMLMYIK